MNRGGIEAGPAQLRSTADLDSRVTFMTSSMGTKWTAYSQALLERNFPAAKRHVVNGKRAWNPLFFLDHLRQVNTEYLVLVDEDCFIFDRHQFATLIEEMDAQPRVAVMGTPDGGTFHRDFNPFACNTFFLIVRIPAARAALERTSKWRDLDYEDVSELVDERHIGQLDRQRIHLDRTEPYYCFYWAILHTGSQIRYLIPAVDPCTLGSSFSLAPHGDPLFVHMWWLRRWFSTETDPYLGATHLARYRQLEHRLLMPEFQGPRAWLMLLKHRTANLAFRAASKFGASR